MEPPSHVFSLTPLSLIINGQCILPNFNNESYVTVVTRRCGRSRQTAAWSYRRSFSLLKYQKKETDDASSFVVTRDAMEVVDLWYEAVGSSMLTLVRDRRGLTATAAAAVRSLTPISRERDGRCVSVETRDASKVIGSLV